MSWWTEFRDGLETAAAIAVNYFYPGLGALGYYVNSEGSQEQLRSPLGAIGMLGAGLAGGFAPGAFTGEGAAATGEGAAQFGAATPESFDYTSAWANSGDTLSNSAPGLGSGAPDYGDLNYAGSDQVGQGPGPVGTAGGQANPYDNFGDLRGTPTQGQGDVYNATGAGTRDVFNARGVVNNGMLTNFNPSGAGVKIPWSSPAGIANLGSSALGLIGASQMLGAGKNADPFAEQRKKYAEAMGQLAADPNSIYTMPGYRAGEQAVKRAMAAQGYTGSGNVLAALQKYGGDFYNNTMNLYGGLAGANVNPVDAARLNLQGNQSAIDLAGRSLGTLGYQSWMGGNQWGS